MPTINQRAIKYTSSVSMKQDNCLTFPFFCKLAQAGHSFPIYMEGRIEGLKENACEGTSDNKMLVNKCGYRKTEFH